MLCITSLDVVGVFSLHSINGALGQAEMPNVAASLSGSTTTLPHQHAPSLGDIHLAFSREVKTVHESIESVHSE